MGNKDSLGDRMKGNYENRTKQFLPRRTYTIIRLDGKAFHTFTKQFEKPYDLQFMEMMNQTAIALCSQIQGAKLAYVQSDEITIVLTDFETNTTDAWFDGNIQKITSVSASIATAEFNRQYMTYLSKKAKDERKAFVISNGGNNSALEGNLNDYINSGDVEVIKFANFDSRVFTIPELEEVINCLIWRQQDATRNAIQMLGQTHFSHKELHGKSTSDIQDMLMLQKGINFNDQPIGFKRGRVISKESYTVEPSLDYKGFLETVRTRWVIHSPPIFTQDRAYLYNIIPSHGLETRTSINHIVTLPDGVRIEQVEGR